MNNKLKVLVIPSDKFGCGYFRSLNPHQYLFANYGDIFDIDIVENLNPNTNWGEYFKQYDIIHLHKQLDNDCILIQLMKENGCKVVVDVDDYFMISKGHPMFINDRISKENAQPTINHLKLADMVTTPTDIYKKELLKLNNNVVVIPNAINPTENQFISKPTPSDRLRFGVICGSSHQEDVKILRDSISILPADVLNKIQIVLCGFDTEAYLTGSQIVLRGFDTGAYLNGSLIDPHSSVYFKYEEYLTNNYGIVSPEYENFLKNNITPNMEYTTDNVPYKRYWTKNINKYATHYNNIDVLLVPLAETKFNSMKSQLKVVEAGFMHKAIIAQNFGPYTIDLVPMVEKGGKVNANGNSLLVDSSKNHKQWAKYITMLANDRKMVEMLQNNLYNTVKDKYSLSEVSKIRVNAYQSLVC